MASSRNLVGDKGFMGDDAAPLSYWMADRGPVTDQSVWRPVGGDEWFGWLMKTADGFPRISSPEEHETQRHVTLFVHGYNNGWSDAAGRYGQLCRDLFEGDSGLGVCVLFTWPSMGSVAGYLPDRDEARASAPALAELLLKAWELIVDRQQRATDAVLARVSRGRPAGTPAMAGVDLLNICKAKTSIIAHSMGNYVVQKALARAWTTRNRPQLLSLVNQLVMVAADVDNDLFSAGESQDASDGTAVANLCYRVTSLYTGLDRVLGLSAGVKHFGKRRLGRSGLDYAAGPPPDNVWERDCTAEIRVAPGATHSAYFESRDVLGVMRRVLQGMDRAQVG